ncbi:ribonuclease P [Candidatus Woesearchaeota archaeon]|nr:ribonuclease P [Candidatus Woesearchaeota archaeon]
MPGKTRPKKRRYQKKPSSTLSDAKDHIQKLFTQAKKAAKDNPALANRYTTLARKVAMKFKIRLTPEQKRLFCPHCYKFLLPGRNLRVRIHQHRVIYYCLNCKKFWRKPISKKSFKKT